MGKSLIPDEMVAREYLFARFGATVTDYDRAADEDTRLEIIDVVMMIEEVGGRGSGQYCSARQLGQVVPGFLVPRRGNRK